LPSLCFRGECQLAPDIEPDVKQTALNACLRPTPDNGQEDTLLAVTHHKCWCRYGGQQLTPRIGGFIPGPMPGDDVFGSPSDETNQRANVNTVQDNGVVYFAGRLRLRGDIPTPRRLVAPRTGSRAGRQLILRLLAEQPGHKVFEHELAAKVRPLLDLRTATLRTTVTLRSGSCLAPFL